MTTKHVSSAEQAATQTNRLWMAVILGSLVGIGPLVTDLYLPALPQMAANLNASTSPI